jgi:hypothetical protein
MTVSSSEQVPREQAPRDRVAGERVPTDQQLRRGRVVERQYWGPIGVAPGMILGALGAIGVIVSMFLPWRDGGVYPSDIPVEFLWNRSATSDPSLLVLLIPVGAVLVIGALVPLGAGVRLFGALCMLVIAGVFAYQLHRVVHAFGGNFGDALDTGFYVAALGGILAFVSGLVPASTGARREVVRSDEFVEDDRTVEHA